MLNAQHVAFTDIPLILDLTGTRTNLSAAAQALVGTISGERALRIVSDYLIDYFGFVLRGNMGEGLLSGPSEKYPDVVILD